jgi:biopolymer transport protein ExbD
MATNLQSEDGDLGFQIAPMVDVVFVLMLFFLACVGFEEHRLDAKIPPPGYGTPEISINVTIARDGTILVLDRLISPAEDRHAAGLRRWLDDTRDSYGTRDPIVIQPAPTVPHERVMQVLNAANAAGWTKIAFR